MADYPALPFFTDSYMRDCWHLSDAEHGRYLKLLILIWQSPRCRIPNESEWISRKIGKTLEEYESQIVPLLKEFCQTSGNWITQKRLTREWNFLRKNSETQSDRAKSRWRHNKKYTRAMPDRCRIDAPTPTPTPTPSKKDTNLENSNNLDTSVGVRGESDSTSLRSAPDARPKKKSNGSHPNVKGTRLPEEWSPKADDIVIGYDLGLTEQQARLEFAKFKDYWLAQPGTRGVKLNWNATWRNWLRKAADDAGRRRIQ